jgi:hypothetical protein
VPPDFLTRSGSGTGPLNLVSTIEEVLGRKSSGSGLENRKYARRDPSRWPRGSLCPQIWYLSMPATEKIMLDSLRQKETAVTALCSCNRRVLYSILGYPG